MEILLAIGLTNDLKAKKKCLFQKAKSLYNF